METVVTQPKQEKQKGKSFDYSQRAQCLRAIVLGGNEGLVSIALTLIMVGSFMQEHDPKVVLITGFTTLIAGALSIATAEFVSCYTQVDIMDSRDKRCMCIVKLPLLLESQTSSGETFYHSKYSPKFLTTRPYSGQEDIVRNTGAPNPTQIALAASLAYAVAGIIPLVTACFVNDNKMRLIVAVTTTCLSMLVLGTIGASLGKAPIARSCVRVLFGGCVEVMILVAKSEVLESYRVAGDE